LASQLLLVLGVRGRFPARSLSLGLIGLVAASALPARAHAQPRDAARERAVATGGEDQRLADALYPGAGRFAFTAASGLPFVGLGEAAVGIGDRFALGVLAGVTPRVATFGARVRGAPLELGRFRFSVVVPVLYYPRTNAIGGAPWMLLRGSALIEYAVDARVRSYLGLGLVMASTLARIGRELGADDYSDGATAHGSPLTRCSIRHARTCPLTRSRSSSTRTRIW
jgi:hypothetical protein